jgi:hypothetical protein
MSFNMKMSFLDYYQLVGNIQFLLREKVMEELEISYGTFFNKMRNDSWSAVEREKIQQIYSDHITELVKNLGAC